MKKLQGIKTLCRLFLVIAEICIAGRVAFYICHLGMIREGGDADFFGMLIHGLRLDVAVAGYLCALPAILLIVGSFLRSRYLAMAWTAVMALEAFIIALAFVANIGLYGYWEFPLDDTSLFYIFTSTKVAMASITWWQAVGGIIFVAAATALVFLAMPKARKEKGTVAEGIALIVLAAMLIIPMRGGTTVATNNVGTVYFSDNIRLNHAAVNPLFSFMESVSHSDDFASRYRFLDADEADRIFASMTYTAQRTDTVDWFAMPEKDIRVIIVVLESFSTYITDEAGHVKGITPTINRLMKEGVYFSNFYANSFRTDRGLMAILSGFPAQPTASIMKYPHKTNGIYSISRTLGKSGYVNHYIYGGDANFTNMRSYLMATGFNDIIAEENYPASMRDSKWGVNDGNMFRRALKEIDSYPKNSKTFTVIQTSSSHEPFEVPVKVMDNERLNAFHYTDTELGRFIAELRKDPEEWARTLMVVVPDHIGCYPEHLDNKSLYRYQIPLIMTGGTILKAQRITTIGSQQDIAATLLAMLGEKHGEFTFSKDLLDTKAPHFAFFTVPDLVGMVTEENSMIHDNVSGRVVLDEGRAKGSNLKPAKAYLQKLYDNIAGMKK